ncbi:MAG TPA: hypothetical protein PKC87_00185 [Candidatus Absconditabacterales bacterium]|nr:hypothetical protein [Candidatus Absconditabacterales bacterium]
MKKMFSLLVLVLSLSLNVSAQHATPHAAPHVTVTPHVTSTPHVSVPTHVTVSPHTGTTVHASKSVTTKPVSTSKLVTEPVTTVVPLVRPLIHTSANVNKVDSTENSKEAEVKQSTPPLPSTKEDNSSSGWALIGVFCVILGLILYVTFYGPNENPSEVEQDSIKDKSTKVEPKSNK